MPIINDSFRPELERIAREWRKLKQMTIKVGIQGKDDGDILKIARVHEFGAVIKAKNVKNLAIPLEKEAKGKSPRDFEGLFFVKDPDTGYLYGCVQKTKRSKPKYLFLLLPSVTIPERSFIRASYDNGMKALEEACRYAVTMLVEHGWTAEQAANHVGLEAVAMTQNYFNTSISPPKGKLTQSLSTQYQPLYETGRLFHSIGHWVENGG